MVKPKIALARSLCFRHTEVDGCKKTEMLVLGPKKQRDLLLNLTINLGGCTVVSNKTVKDLCGTLDPDLFFDEHIKTVSRTAFYHLRNIAKIRKFLSKIDAEK